LVILLAQLGKFSVKGWYKRWQEWYILLAVITQVGDYVSQHLQYAGVDQQIFSDGAVDEIHRFSGGTARLINKVCTHSLLYGAQNGRRIIDDHMIKHVIQGELS
jgi:type II secretory pathway predicted ATPase ExeA